MIVKNTFIDVDDDLLLDARPARRCKSAAACLSSLMAIDSDDGEVCENRPLQQLSQAGAIKEVSNFTCNGVVRDLPLKVEAVGGDPIYTKSQLPTLLKPPFQEGVAGMKIKNTFLEAIDIESHGPTLGLRAVKTAAGRLDMLLTGDGISDDEN